MNIPHHNYYSPYFGALAIPDNFIATKETEVSLDPVTRIYRAGAQPGVFRYAHGTMAAAQARMVDPNIEIKPYQIEVDEAGKIDFLPAFRKILGDIKQGSDIDKVSISIGLRVGFDSFLWTAEEALGISKLNRENLKQYQPLLRKNIDRIPWGDIPPFETPRRSSEYYANYIKKCIEILEEIVDQGIPVFIAAGNFGFNPLLLADGVIGVGADRKDGENAIYNGEHSLIQVRTKEAGLVKPVLDNNGKLIGFTLGRDVEDVIDSDEVHISLNELYIDTEVPRADVLLNGKPTVFLNKDNKFELRPEGYEEKEENRFAPERGGLCRFKTVTGGTSFTTPQAAAES